MINKVGVETRELEAIFRANTAEFPQISDEWAKLTDQKPAEIDEKQLLKGPDSLLKRIRRGENAFDVIAKHNPLGIAAVSKLDAEVNALTKALIGSGNFKFAIMLTTRALSAINITEHRQHGAQYLESRFCEQRAIAEEALVATHGFRNEPETTRLTVEDLCILSQITDAMRADLRKGYRQARMEEVILRGIKTLGIDRKTQLFGSAALQLQAMQPTILGRLGQLVAQKA